MGQKFEFLTISSLYVPYISATAKIEAYKQRMKLFDPPCRNTEICPPGKAVWNANGGFVSVLLTHLFRLALMYCFSLSTFIYIDSMGSQRLMDSRLHWLPAVCFYLPPTKEEVNAFARVRLSVCLSVRQQDHSKTRAWIWMKCRVSTDVET